MSDIKKIYENIEYYIENMLDIPETEKDDLADFLNDSLDKIKKIVYQEGVDDGRDMAISDLESDAEKLCETFEDFMKEFLPSRY